jgi:PIN domain nuclease of toxin-antitoxin system
MNHARSQGATWGGKSGSRSAERQIKQTAGKLDGPPDLAERVRDMGFRELPVTDAHAIAAGRLPVHHFDPFDRMLVAQAMVEGLTLVTRDADIQRYDVEVLAP